jgi:nucleotide-binding universal stress UspA family protein
MMYRAVIGVDGSPHSAAALRWALAEAATHAGEATAVLAWQPPFLSVPGAAQLDELEQAYKDYLVSTVRAIAPSPQVELTTLVAQGDPIESLILAAKGADVLVLGVKGRSRFAGLMLGSVSQACAAASPCPVVLVREGDA